MVKIGRRAPSDNIIDRRPNAQRNSRRTGVMVTLGFLSVVATSALGVAVTGVNEVMTFVGIERQIAAPDLTPERRVEIDEFAAVILGDTERIWSSEFQSVGAIYEPTKLVFYEEQTTSGCGVVLSIYGPIYCSFDRQIYLDLAFFNEVAGYFGAGGDFPPAYIIAHEVAHHVQKLTGEMDRFYELLDAGTVPGNQLTMRLELQADCIAGVWTKKADRAFDLLDLDDIDEGVHAARQFGDDTLQLLEQGYINEASFTHGSGEQRARWFMTGYERAELIACDTWSPEFGEL